MTGKEPDRREEIMKVALELFAEKGYHRTKISDMVNRAGVAQGTFYWYFKSKAAIATEIIQSGEERLLEVVSKGYRQVPGTVQDAVSASRSLFIELFQFSQDNRHLMELLLKGMDTEETVKEAVLKARRRLEEGFRQNITRAIDLGILPANDPTLQAALLTSLLEGMLERWLFSEHSDLTGKTADEMARELVRFEFFGLLGI
ncbi:TetR family transcriptional regulator [Rossellomorea marisflavi]|uniref:TetR/AcrR family transcriptional regulator n=1 Tax=Rossellomorea TaxID=2837508 RepID=UPI00215B7ADB|nr:TetR family transcriptional regulator [Rossellomorea marisflavi]WJV18362.1 TetR family transcriptional regulator [Rossellomorea marisflavi]